MLHHEVIADPDTLAGFKDEWSKLSNSCACEISTSYEWCEALFASHLQSDDKFLLLVLRDGEVLVGLVPLVLRDDKRFGVSLRVLSPIDEMYNTHSDLLIHVVDRGSAVIDALVEALVNIGCKWDVFRMERLLETNPLIAQLECGLQRATMRFETAKTEPSFFVGLGDDYGQYLKDRSGKFRNHLKRMRKKLTSNGTIEFRSERDFSDVHGAYGQLLQVELGSWKHLHGSSIGSVTRQEDFYRLLCEGAAERGQLHLLFLYFENAPIAYNLGLVNGDTYLYLKTSFDENFRQFAPSTILRAHLVEMLIGDGVAFLDFPGEPYDWERQWADELRWHKSLLVFSKTARAKLFAAYRHAKKTMAGAGGEETLTYRDPRKPKARATNPTPAIEPAPVRR